METLSYCQLMERCLAAEAEVAELKGRPIGEERETFEEFMEKKFGDTMDRRRAKNGDQGYMAWDMVVAWIVWQRRATLNHGGK